MVKKMSTAGSGISAYNYGNSDRVYKTGGMVKKL
jgi:hypothetical protein